MRQGKPALRLAHVLIRRSEPSIYASLAAVYLGLPAVSGAVQ